MSVDMDDGGTATRSWLGRVLSAGSGPADEPEQRRRVVIANQSAVISGLAFVFSAFVFYAAGIAIVPELCAVHALGCAAVIGFNALGKTSLGRGWFVVNVNLSVVGFLVVFGFGPGPESFFLATVCIPLVLFDTRGRRIGVLAGVTIPVAFYAAARVYLRTHEPLVMLEGSLADFYFGFVQVASATILVLVVGYFFSISERLRSARELAHRRTQWRLDRVLIESEQRYSLAAQGANDGLWEWSSDTDQLYLSDRWKKILGLEESEPASSFEYWYGRVHPEDHERVVREFDEHLVGHSKRLRTEHRLRHSDGAYRWVLVQGQALRGSDGRATRMAGWMADITDARHARERLEQSEERFRQVMRQAADALVLLDSNGVIVEANDRAAAIVGGTREDLINAHLSDVDPAVNLAALRRQSKRADAQEGGRSMLTYTHHRPDGSEVPLELHVGRVDYGGASYLLMSARDMTERKHMEAQLILADRMVSVGTLAAGVAHEINNPLTALMLNLELIERQISEAAQHFDGPSLARVRRGLMRSREGGERVGVIVRDLKTFSRDQEDLHTKVDLQHVIESTLGLSHAEVRQHAQTTLDYDGPSAVIANESRLGQVVLNLVLNAAHAFGDRPARDSHIEVRVRAHTAGEVALEVRDDGPGMTAAVAARVFDPFFTTKPAGVGTGLGLFVCRNIVEGFGGRIQVESAPGKGTTFRVLLPIAEDSAEHVQHKSAVKGSWPPEEAAPRPSVPPPALPSSRILLIDPEPQVSQTLQDVFGDHEVAVARDSVEALGLLESEGAFDLVLCDLELHEQSQGSVYRRVRESNPPVARRFVFMSGHAPGQSVANGDGREFIEKPVRSVDLWQLLKQEGVA